MARDKRTQNVGLKMNMKNNQDFDSHQNPRVHRSCMLAGLTRTGFTTFNILSEFHIQEIPGNTLDFYKETIIYCLLKKRKISIDRSGGIRQEITPYEILRAVMPNRGNGAIKTIDLVQNIVDTA